MRISGAESGEDVELSLETLLLVVEHEVVVAATYRGSGEPAGHDWLVFALAEPVAGLGIDHQELVVQSGGEAAGPRGDVVSADGPSLTERILDAEVRGSGHPEEGVALEGEEEFLTVWIHRPVVARVGRLDAEYETCRYRWAYIPVVEELDLRLEVETGLGAYVVDGLETGVESVVELVAGAEVHTCLEDEVEPVEVIVAVGVVRDVEDVVRLEEADVVDDGVGDDRLAEEVLGPVAVRHHRVAHRHLHAVDRGRPPACAEAVSKGIARALRVVTDLVEALHAGAREQIHPLQEGPGSVETHFPALPVGVTVAEHVLLRLRGILLLGITADSASQKDCRYKKKSEHLAHLHRLCCQLFGCRGYYNIAL